MMGAVIAKTLRTGDVRIKLSFKVEATAPDGFKEADTGVVRDDARRLRCWEHVIG